MLQPKNDKRKFEKGILSNNIQYIITQDSTIDTAHVYVNIGVGSYCDSYDGIAHFLEHMLFLGSTKYPQESYFSDKVSEFGGTNNAYTSLFNTVYFFSINNKKLNDVLDIFSRFFIDPLFNENCIKRELNAVNSEHYKNKNNEIWYIHQTILNLAKSNYNRFTTGSLKTLNKPDIREKMIEFYNNYYCSDNITISIVSPTDISIIKTYLNNTFGNIIEKQSKKYEKKKLEFKQSNTQYQIISKNKTDLKIIYYFEFELPEMFSHNQIQTVILSVINNNHKNNLKRKLKKTQYINTISSMLTEEGILIINISINEKYNNKKYIQEIHNIMNDYFNKYINFNWEYIYNYVQENHKFFFEYGDFENSDDLGEILSYNIRYYDDKYIYAGDKIIIKKEYEKLKDYIQKINIKKCSILYFHADDIGITNKLYDDNYEFYYGPINLYDNNIISQLQTIYDINYDINIFKNNNPYLLNGPEIIPFEITPNNWYGFSSIFNEYSVIGNIYLHNINLFSNLQDYILYNISILILNDYLKIKFENYIDIGYNVYFQILLNLSTIKLTIEAYNNNYLLFVNKIIYYLENLKNDKEIIIHNINNFIESIKNYHKIPPLFFSSIVIKNNISINSHRFENINKYINMIISQNKMDLFIKKICLTIKKICNFNNFNVTTFSYGNIHYQNIPQFNYNCNKICFIDIFKIPNIKYKHPNENEENKCISYVFNMGKFDLYKNTILLLIESIISNHTFNYLRTKKQLGYTVESYISQELFNYYLIITVLSHKDINIVKKEIEYFYKVFFVKQLREIKDLNIFKESIKFELLQNEINISEKQAFYSKEIINTTKYFNRNKDIVNIIDNITIENIIDLYLQITQQFTNIIIY
jgi:insulysin